MPILEVEVKNNIQLGKFGSSFLDLQDPVKDRLRLTFSSEPVDPFFQDDPLVCRPDLTRSKNRPNFAIERGNIPQFNCDIPEALDKEIDFLYGGKLKNLDVDPFLTTDEDIFDDITKSEFLGDRVPGQNDPNKVDLLVPVSGISMSLYDGQGLNARLLQTPKINFAFGLGNDQLSNTYQCQGSNEILAPEIITDTRNRQGVNLGNNPNSQRWSWFWSYQQRFYLEIRHGLNTENYTAHATMLTANGNAGVASGWQLTHHKNTLVMAFTTPKRSQSQGGFFNAMAGRHSIMIPKGRINVFFMADPCDVRQSQLAGNGPGGDL